MKQDATAFAVGGSYANKSPRLFIPADTTSYYGPTGWMKRAFDIVFASLMLLVAGPIMLVISLMVKKTSSGPILFVQERLGRDGTPFNFYKFRSMKHNSDDAIHREFAAMFISGDEESCSTTKNGEKVFKMERDPRITSIGAFLRKTSLDELPQLLNILKGEMTLVGPRPPIAYEIENYQPWHMERLKAVPGLTGLWQVSGRSSVSFDEMVRLDIRYINEWTLWKDVVIMLKTLPVVLKGTGGY